MATTSMQFGQSAINVVLNEGQLPAKLSTDASGNTVLVGADGVPVPLYPIGVTSVYANAAQTITNNAENTLSYGVELVDTLGAWVVSSPTEFVVPAGAYAMEVNAHVEWAIGGTGYRSFRMLINGAQASAPYRSLTDVRRSVGTISDHQHLSGSMGCTPGDVLTFVVRQNADASATVDTIFGNGASTYVAIKWLNKLSD